MNATDFPARISMDEVEHGLTLRPKFDENGLIPCITQDAASGQVLMFAFMNAEALGLTLSTGKATYWSRSRNKLWVKGEESGNIQWVKEVLTDCDQDVILLKVDPRGSAACHNGYASCFYRRLADAKTFRLEHAGGERLFDPASVYKKK